jgi:biotin-dependent carboxylase-like uncharacterized protein
VITVLSAGLQTTVQDLGRPGHAHLGVPTSGAADRRGHRLANRVVGNPDSAACLETLMGGLTLRFGARAVVAVTGAPAPVALGSRAHALCTPIHISAGQTLRIGTPHWGLRTYVAVRGGIDVPSTLGSRATDTLSGLGPAPLAAGDELPVGAGADRCPPGADLACAVLPPPGDTVVKVRPGPRTDWFVPGAFTTMISSPWTMTAETNRVGARLTGPALAHRGDAQLPTEGVVCGAVEVPPSGQPIVFLADCPTTGGYPVIGVVARQDVWLLAQARPGSRVWFDAVRGT